MKDKEKAQQLLDLWDEHSEDMGEMAAYCVACEELGINEEDGWDMIADLDEGDKTK